MSKNNLKLNKEEKDILKAIENDEIVSVGIQKDELQELQRFVRHTFTKTISICMLERTLLRIKAATAQEGIPYQTFISSVLHKQV